MASTPDFKYYKVPEKRSAEDDRTKRSELETKTKDKRPVVFNQIQKLRNFADGDIESSDVFIYSRAIRLINRWIGFTAFPSDVVYLYNLFLCVPVFVDEGTDSLERIAHGSFVEGLAAANQISTGVMAIVIVSEDQLISLAGLHAFFIYNMHNAYTARDERTYMELLSAYGSIFKSEFAAQIEKITEIIQKTSTKAFSIGFQLAKIMRDCNTSTPESIARCAQRYRDLLDGVFRPTLVLKI